jgi:NadR type nicotinamide-nucleotide adenylyltransferase
MDTVKKIVLLGAESTGKSTLAAQLAQHFGTLWCPEFARTYLSMKSQIEQRAANQIVSVYDDIEPIAIGQLTMENSFGEQAKHLLFCDTNLLTNLIYSKYYFEKYPDWLVQTIHERQYDLYLLLANDVAWVYDPLRDRPHAREALYHIFKDALLARQQKFVEIKGLGAQRLDNAIGVIKDFLD